MSYTIKLGFDDCSVLSRALDNYRSNNLSCSIKDFQALLVKYPHHPEFLLYIAKIYFKQGSFVEAKKFLDSCLQVSSNNLEAWLTYGNIAYKEDCYKKAAQYYRKALAYDNANPAALYNLANVNNLNDLNIIYVKTEKI